MSREREDENLPEGAVVDGASIEKNVDESLVVVVVGTGAPVETGAGTARRIDSAGLPVRTSAPEVSSVALNPVNVKMIPLKPAGNAAARSLITGVCPPNSKTHVARIQSPPGAETDWLLNSSCSSRPTASRS